MKKIDVLDNGYVALHDALGTDLTISNAAKVSYDKKSTELTNKDRNLISFLAREGHTSPFRHAFLQFEVYAPLMVTRQHWKYIVGSDHTMDAWNESSRRYITEEPVYYVPKANEWRSAPENSKQGSGPVLDVEIGEILTADLEASIKEGIFRYDKALAIGVAPEQARGLLNATYFLYVRYYWSTSLQGVCHVLNQRLAHDSQYEFQQYAKAILELAKEKFPISVSELVKRD